MRAVVVHEAGDVRVVKRSDPTLEAPTDAIIKMELTCVCSSGLWAYRGLDGEIQDRLMGHEYVGVVEEVGAEVKNVKAGDLVVGSFVASDNTCEICQAGYQSFCTHAEMVGGVGTQAEYARIPHLIEFIKYGTIDPGVVFGLELPLADPATAYAAMDERRATKALLTF